MNGERSDKDYEICNYQLSAIKQLLFKKYLIKKQKYK